LMLLRYIRVAYTIVLGVKEKATPAESRIARGARR